VIGIGLGFALDAAIEANSGSDNSGLVMAGNAASGDAIALTVRTQDKSRGGIAWGITRWG